MNNSCITGSERREAIDSPHVALVDFYRAFNGRDAGLMERNWSATEEASMSNPLGGIRRGWSEIKPVYERIFHGEARVYVEFYDYTIHHHGEMFCAVGRERGWMERGAERIDLAIRTTRIYRREDGDWRQLHHHGSIENPALLGHYQAAVLSE